jgi:hypothetical protein
MSYTREKKKLAIRRPTLQSVHAVPAWYAIRTGCRKRVVRFVATQQQSSLLGGVRRGQIERFMGVRLF